MRELAASSGPASLRVNIGCGRSPTTGWCNYDASISVALARYPVVVAGLRAIGMLSPPQYQYMQFCRTANIRRADATRLPIASGTVDVLYSCHMLEHLDRDDARRFLAEAHRALRPGGILRVAVPDLAYMVSEYGRNYAADRFMDMAMLGRRRARSLRERVTIAVFGDPGHKWMYDAASLIALVTEAGFSNAASLPPGDTTIPEPGPLDLFERAGETLYVEAQRL